MYSFWHTLKLKLWLKVDSCLGPDSGFVIVNPHTLFGSQTLLASAVEYQHSLEAEILRICLA